MKRTKMIAEIIPKRPCRNVEPLHPDAPFVRNVSLMSVKLRAPVLRVGYGVDYKTYDFFIINFCPKNYVCTMGNKTGCGILIIETNTLLGKR